MQRIKFRNVNVYTLCNVHCAGLQYFCLYLPIDSSCIVYNVQCTLYSAQCTLYNCTMHTIQLYNVHYTTVQCTLYNCTMYTIQLYNVHYTTAQCTYIYVIKTRTIFKGTRAADFIANNSYIEACFCVLRNAPVDPFKVPFWSSTCVVVIDINLIWGIKLCPVANEHTYVLLN